MSRAFYFPTVTLVLALLVGCPDSPDKFVPSPGLDQAGDIDGDGILNAVDPDLDGDGILNSLEQNGFGWKDLDLVACDELPDGEPCYFTDPESPSTDGDPYNDFEEAANFHMPSEILPPANHPLVAARPNITLTLVDLDVTPIAEITRTNEKTLAEGSEFTIETSTSIGVDVELSAEPGVTYSTSTSVAQSQSVTQESSRSWGTAESQNTAQAATVKLRAFLFNHGNAPALNVRPTFNLTLGGRTLATITPTTVVSELPPGGRYPPDEPDVIVVDQHNEDSIYLSLRDLIQIQQGAEITITLTQLDSRAKTYDNESENWVDRKRWDNYENDIDARSLTVDTVIRRSCHETECAHDEHMLHSVFAGSAALPPKKSIGELLDSVLRLKRDVTGEVIQIEGYDFPAEWYLGTSTPSLAKSDDWKGKTAMHRLSAVPQPGSRILLTTTDMGPSVMWTAGVKDTVQTVVIPSLIPIESVFLRWDSGETHELVLDDADRPNHYVAHGPFPADVNLAYVRAVDTIGNIGEKPVNPSEKLANLCIDLKSSGRSSDGEYEVSLDQEGKKRFKVFCKSMNSDAPKSYLILPKTRKAEEPYGQTSNVSVSKKGGAYTGDDLIVAYKGLLISSIKDEALNINVNDTGHTIKNDLSKQYEKRKQRPWPNPGSAANCLKMSSKEVGSYGKLDVRGTGFRIADDSKWLIHRFTSYKGPGLWKVTHNVTGKKYVNLLEMALSDGTNIDITNSDYEKTTMSDWVKVSEDKTQVQVMSLDGWCSSIRVIQLKLQWADAP